VGSTTTILTEILSEKHFSLFGETTIMYRHPEDTVL
jgi:hypothetical protein